MIYKQNNVTINIHPNFDFEEAYLEKYNVESDDGNWILPDDSIIYKELFPKIMFKLYPEGVDITREFFMSRFPGFIVTVEFEQDGDTDILNVWIVKENK